MAVHELCQGAVLRLCIMMTHYRRPVDFTDKRIQEAKTILERWVKVATPTQPPWFCPVEILECYCEDMNTAKAIAIMHTYCKDKQGDKLFNAMKFLGFFGDTVHISEVKTLPQEYEVQFGADTLVVTNH